MHRFGIDGTEYEIDLTTEHADKLRATLTEYAGKAGGRRGQGSKSPRHFRVSLGLEQGQA